MKNISFILLLSAIFLMISCYSTQTAGGSGKVPPGQAKKRTGSKSARGYAPGQQKKY